MDNQEKKPKKRGRKPKNKIIEKETKLKLTENLIIRLNNNEKEDITNISECLIDDLNTPGFIAKIHELYNAAVRGDKKSKTLFNNACRLLGLFNINKDEWNDFKKLNTNISEEIILKMINKRDEAKKNKNFDLADKIRNELSDKGVSIEDSKGETTWKFK